MKKKYVKYFHLYKEITEDFVLSKKQIPDWYKKIPPYQDSIKNEPTAKTVKKCIPFLEAMTTGYMVLTSQDVNVKNDPLTNEYDITWVLKSENLVYIKARDFPINIPIPEGFRDTHFVWHVPFTFLLPRGYSALITHPLNRTDLPFYTTSGIVDTDDYPLTRGDYPFLLKKGFTGIIPAGTPVMQIIPFKRESWEKVFSSDLEKLQDKTSFQTSKVFTGFYKKNIWKQKDFE